jgi:hypothetical protein
VSRATAEARINNLGLFRVGSSGWLAILEDNMCDKVKCMLVAIGLFCLCACGTGEKIYDSQNYESLTNEVGTIYVLSGGKITHTFEDAKILYSSSDTQAMWVICKGKNYYLQGNCVIELH